MTSPLPPPSQACQADAAPRSTLAMPTYGQVKDAVLAAPDLTPKVALNLLRAVDIAIVLMGRASVNGAVDIPSLQRRLEKTTPAMLGFQNATSYSAFQSNLRRALRIASVAVMPGKSRTPLGPAWRALRVSARTCWREAAETPTTVPSGSEPLASLWRIRASGRASRPSRRRCWDSRSCRTAFGIRPRPALRSGIPTGRATPRGYSVIWAPEPRRSITCWRADNSRCASFRTCSKHGWRGRRLAGRALYSATSRFTSL
ncbi:hypothetical protein AAFN86_00915 [Roseomonas sp. CAU 1739]|uniref:hypothetical protein n=1 Tax=Roseomonas sp. CAU 1739 TaxID=3140364 RepID=UPI00325C00A2